VSMSVADPVLYGRDSFTECGVDLTLEQLRQFCQQRSSSVLPVSTTPLPQYFANLPADLYLAIWGDSDPSVTEEWIQVAQEQAGMQTEAY
jgi:hypothetical protein